MFSFFKKERKNIRELINENNFWKALQEAEIMCFDSSTMQQGFSFIKELSDRGYLSATSILSTIYKRGGFYSSKPKSAGWGKQIFVSLVKPDQETQMYYEILGSEQAYLPINKVICNPDEEQRKIDRYLGDYLYEMAKKGYVNINNDKILKASINLLKKAWKEYKDNLYVTNIRELEFITVSGISIYAGTNPTVAYLSTSFEKFFEILSKFPSSHPEVKELLHEINNCLDVETVLLSPGIEGVIIKNGKWYGREKYSNYDEYLKSDVWKIIRNKILERDGYACKACNAIATQVHHKSYSCAWGYETGEVLVSVCDSCHHQFHHLQKIMDSNTSL